MKTFPYLCICAGLLGGCSGDVAIQAGVWGDGPDDASGRGVGDLGAPADLGEADAGVDAPDMTPPVDAAEVIDTTEDTAMLPESLEDAGAGVADASVDVADIAADVVPDAVPDVVPDAGTLSLQCPEPAKITCQSGVCSCECGTLQVTLGGCPTNAMAFPICKCTPAGLVCMDHPEYQCPQVCIPGQKLDKPCADGSSVPWCECKAPACQPQCKTLDDGSTGWFNPCTGTLIPAACESCPLKCEWQWTDMPAWVDQCSGKTLWTDDCEAHYACNPGAKCETTACSGATSAVMKCKTGDKAPLCHCEQPDGSCPPKCGYDAVGGESWVDACSGKVIQVASCIGCTVSCDKIGSKSEGWYSSCGGLIAWANCGKGTWTCSDEPWKGCVAVNLCKGQGQSWTEPDEVGVCCAGLVERDMVGWDGKACAPVDCLCKECLPCGDGQCTGKENPCNCPEDCGTVP